VPANDAFGGWVYWSRIPRLGIEQIEVVRGGGSSAWGNYALGGVVQILTRRPTERALFFDASYGTRETMNFDLLLQDVEGPFRISLEGNYFSTDGYHVVKAARGARSTSTRIRVIRPSTGGSSCGYPRGVVLRLRHLLLRGAQQRHAAPDQSHRLRLRSDRRALGTPEDGEWRFVAFADTQEFRSTFSNQAANRNSETLALDQRVPTTSAGGGLQWSHRFGAHLAAAGGDARWVQGETDERVYNAGAFVRTRDAGGQQFIAGVFIQDVYTPIPSLELVGGIRGDYWYSYDGTRHDTRPRRRAAEQTSTTSSASSRAAVAGLYHATPTTDLRASA